MGSFYEYRAWWLSQSPHDSQVEDNICQTVEICLQQASQFTEQALYLAQPDQNPYLAYQWEWQLARLLQAQGKKEQAIFSYSSAIKTLAKVRNNLLTINSEIQFNFRDNVEPLYRDIVNLLLEEKTSYYHSESPLLLSSNNKQNQNSSIPQENLQNALNYLKLLQVAELENFLSCSLLNNQEFSLDNIVDHQNLQEAVIYPIIFQNQIKIILKLPRQELKLYTSFLCENREEACYNKLENVLKNIENNLPEPDGAKIVQTNSQELYQWLIKPLEQELEKNRIKTLVFLLDRLPKI